MKDLLCLVEWLLAGAACSEKERRLLEMKLKEGVPPSYSTNENNITHWTCSNIPVLKVTYSGCNFQNNAKGCNRSHHNSLRRTS
ncbi:hypothetical protein TNCV_2086331 [Trichonephila clavipes]|nr:hypothetical protein TNCV_2086331 [Trichonephila clavipes]